METFLISLTTALVTTATTLFVTWQTIRRQYRLEFAAENIARELLEHDKWRLRTFKTIKHHLGGFEDNDLRRILVRAGAVRFSDDEGVEIWGLIGRNRDLLDSEYGTSKN